ncbi:FRG domain-containing protein [Paenibacillus sp. FSL K6-1230]|uniref:FRG domain-containing protein n=1 Tax=Paenibacillus sp. FSL K6-1230 TaxID=2921603 RepID=UPI0030F9BBEA
MDSHKEVIKTIVFESAEELFNELSPFGKYSFLLFDNYIFRGESTTKYKLLPTALREENNQYLWDLLKPNIDKETFAKNTEYAQRFAEYQVLFDFFVISDRNGLRIPHNDEIRYNMSLPFGTNVHLLNIWLPKSFHELAALAQHYGLPTRLLDWSLDPFVSLYFGAINALKNDLIEGDHLVMWVLDVAQLTSLNRPVKQIPLSIINPPYSGNENLKAQKGILTLWEDTSVSKPGGEIQLLNQIDRTPLDELLIKILSNNEEYQGNSYPMMFKLLLPTTQAPMLVSALKTINYSAASLFPGFDGITKSIKEYSLLGPYFSK